MRTGCRRLVRSLVRGAPVSAGVGQVSCCGLPVGSGVVLSGGRVFGLGWCGSWLRCGVCVNRFWRGGGATGRLLDLDSNVCSGGGVVVSQRLSLAHSRSDDLPELLEAQRVGWSSVMNKHRVRVVRRDLGAFPVRIFECKWSPSGGWNPHLHVYWLCANEADRGVVLDRLVGVVADVWASDVPGGRGDSKWASFAHGGDFERGDWAWYHDDSSPYHPSQDCGHVGHSGCPFCVGGPSGLFDDQGSSGGGGFDQGWEPLGDDGGSVDPDWGGSPWSGLSRFGSPGRGVWGAKTLWDSLGFAALVAPDVPGGRRLYRAKLAEFVLSTSRLRVINDLAKTEGRLGVVRSVPVGRERLGVGDGGVLLSGRLWASVLLRSDVDVGRARVLVEAGDVVGLSGLLGCEVVVRSGAWRLGSELSGGVVRDVVRPVIGVGFGRDFEQLSMDFSGV